MLVSDVITRVRDTIGDLDAIQVSNDMLINWMNDGIRECAVGNNLLQKRASQSTVVGTVDYEMPTDILKLYSVYVDNEKLQVMTLQEFEELNHGYGNTSVGATSGRPVYAFRWANKITLFPKPDAVYPLVINYIYTPTLLTTGGLGTEVPLPVGYHSRIVTYCLAQVALQDSDIGLYNLHMQEFATGVQNLKEQHENQEDLYPSISVSSRDMGGEYYTEGYYG
jgi:hypothetical protein